MKAYKRETFGMYYGEKTDVTLSFTKELFDIVVERFGDIPISSRGTDYLIKPTVRVSKTFFAWLTMFEGKIKIISPQEVVGQYIGSAFYVKTERKGDMPFLFYHL